MGGQASENDRALSTLFDNHFSSLTGLATIILGDQRRAEEVVMDAFAKACSSWSKWQRLNQPEIYLRRVVINLCRSRLRRARTELRVNALYHRQKLGSYGPNIEEYVTDLDVWKAVRDLPFRQRAAIVLRYLDDMPEWAIAEVLDCSLGTVKSQLSRARRKLQERLDREQASEVEG